MIEWWGPVLTESYGATEVGTTCAITSEEWLDHPGSVGRPVPPLTAVVRDASGKELPAGGRPAVLPGSDGSGHRVPERSGADSGREPRARALHVGRDRLRRCRRLRLHHRPVQRHGGLGGREHLPSRGGASPGQAPWRARRRLLRRTPPGDGRGADRARRGSRPSASAPIGRPHRLLPGAPGALQCPRGSRSSTTSGARRWARSTSGRWRHATAGRDRPPGHALVDTRFGRQTEDALADDVALYLVGTAGDAIAGCAEDVLGPLVGAPPSAVRHELGAEQQ